MSIARKDERHTEELVDEISDGFNRAVGGDKVEDGKPAQPRFVITGDARSAPPPRRRQNP
jgi:hypothetical protein